MQQAIMEKVKAIRLLILDVDGVLTTGALYYGSHGFEMKGFNIYDGLGIKLLQKAGIKVAIISAKNSEAVSRRIKELNIEHVFLGYEDKIPAFEEVKQTLQLANHEIAYMGDDLPDLPILRRVGFAATVPNAPAIIKQHTDFITKKKGGKGAVREISEFILEAQGLLQSMLQSYLL